MNESSKESTDRRWWPVTSGDESDGKSADRRPRVYLAGKIAKMDWRHGIFRDLRSSSPDSPPADVDGFAYAGPFFVSCDHGCYHGAGSHGVGAPSGDGCFGGDRGFGDPSRTHILCRDWLASADLVLAYIDGPNPYGTVLELGIAAALEIPAFLAFGLPTSGPDADDDAWVDVDRSDTWLSPMARLDFVRFTVRDMWLARRFAGSGGVFGTPALAWAAFREWADHALAIAPPRPGAGADR